MEKVWEIKDPDALMNELKGRRPRRERPAMEEKDPARAYSLSLLFWGGGQLYNDQPVKGILFLALLFILSIAGIASLIFHDRLLQYLTRRGTSLADTFLAAEILLFCVVLFWVFNAGDAYHRAARTRRTRFKGIRSTSVPFFCSLLLPGWGQFLNGQQLKGSIYSAFTVLGIFSIIAVPVTLRVWSFLDAGGSRLFVDAILGVSMLFLPIVPVIWALSSYDAFQVSNNELLKEPLWERIKAANNRRRTQGWVRGVFPQFKRTVLLFLFLFSTLLAIYFYLPMGYYAEWLAQNKAQLVSQGMTVVPDLIDRFQKLITGGGG